MGRFIAIIFLAVVFYIILDIWKTLRKQEVKDIIIESEIQLDKETKDRILDRIKKDIAFRNKMSKIAINKKRDKNGRFISNKVNKKNVRSKK